MARNLQQVGSIKDLNADSWASIFSHYLGRKVRLSNADQARDFKALGGTNDFYNSEIVKITLDFVEEKDGNNSHTFHLVIKNPVGTSLGRTMSRFVRPFMTEVFFLTRASPAFTEISDLFPICYFGSSSYDDQLFHPPACERHCCALCWCCCRKVEEGILVMEDLTVNSSEGQQQNGYKLIPKNKVPSVDHVKMALRALARYHGTWFGFLNSKGKARSDVPFTPEEVRVAFTKDPGMLVNMLGKMVKETFTSVIKLMKNRGEDEAFVNRVRKYADKTFVRRFTTFSKAGSHLQLSVKPIQNLKSHKLQTMLHGDFWSNNFMVREDDQGRPLNIKVLDFQMSSIGHPVFDLLYFLYICTDLDFRRAHLTECLKEYFDVLQGHLRPHIEMAFEDFVREFNGMRDVGIMGGFMTMPNVLSPNQVVIRTFRQMNNLSSKRHLEIASPDKPDDHPDILEIRRRLIDMMRDFDELGLLT